MARRKLSAGIGRLISSTYKLVNRIFGKAEKPPRKTRSPRPKKPEPPYFEIQQTVITKPPVITKPSVNDNAAYQDQINELKKIIEQQQREIEQLKAEREETRRREAEKIEPPSEILDDEEDQPPFEIIDDEEDQPPFEIIDDEEDQPPFEIKDDEQTYTFDDFGSTESLNYLRDFLKDTNLSGIRPDSPFFNMSEVQQQFLLIDYVQYQHDANPSLFYEGKEKLDLVNVPIWGSEFDRFIDNMSEFGNTNDGDGRFDDTLPDWLNDLIDEY